MRNFAKENVSALQLSRMFELTDFAAALKNEELNKNFPKISNEVLRFRQVVIVSDGYDFEKKHQFVNKLAKDVCILAVNKALLKWKLVTPKIPAPERRTINAFILNNPYKECMSYMPTPDTKYFPTCIASTRTNHRFLKQYLGDVYTYTPASEERMGVESAEKYYIDDYRDPVCAAIGLAHQFRAEKVLLLCCDDSFEEDREYAVPLKNGLWTYPQLVRSQEIIDANLYWLTHQENRKVEVADYSSGPEYKNAAYISNEEEALAFLKNQEEGTPNVS